VQGQAGSKHQGQAGSGRLVQGQACGGGRTSQILRDDERGGYFDERHLACKSLVIFWSGSAVNIHRCFGSTTAQWVEVVRDCLPSSVGQGEATNLS
jgi:hypothetical protein